MKVIKKAAAMRILTSDPAYRVGKFDAGHYKWHGSQDAYVGRDVLDIAWVRAVFVERRADAWGPYAVLYCVYLPD